MGVPQPGLTGGYPNQGYPPGRDGAPSGQVRMVGYPPPPPVAGVPPRTGQHMEYFTSGGRYASCVHAGGLSCYRILSLIYVDTKFVINGIIPSEKKICGIF